VGRDGGDHGSWGFFLIAGVVFDLFVWDEFAGICVFSMFGYMWDELSYDCLLEELSTSISG
jgi:hypothetical protein